MYPIIDSHTHIYAEEFDTDSEAMMQRAREAGVYRMVLPSVDSNSYARLMRCLELHPDCLRAAIGLHPTSVGEDYQEELTFVREHLLAHRWVAIGEIGLDYYWDTTYREAQQEVFVRQIEWAGEQGLPIIIHTRSAFADTFTCLREHLAPRQGGVFHSFTGDEEDLEEALSFEHLMIGLNGVVTFRNSRLREYVGRIPLDRLLVETDAPYLSPVPCRGKRNEPAHLIHTIEHLAPLWGVTPQEFAQATARNAERLFDLS